MNARAFQFRTRIAAVSLRTLIVASACFMSSSLALADVRVSGSKDAMTVQAKDASLADIIAAVNGAGHQYPDHGDLFGAAAARICPDVGRPRFCPEFLGRPADDYFGDASGLRLGSPAAGDKRRRSRASQRRSNRWR